MNLCHPSPRKAGGSEESCDCKVIAVNPPVPQDRGNDCSGLCSSYRQVHSGVVEGLTSRPASHPTWWSTWTYYFSILNIYSLQACFLICKLGKIIQLYMYVKIKRNRHTKMPTLKQSAKQMCHFKKNKTECVNWRQKWETWKESIRRTSESYFLILFVYFLVCSG